MKLILTTLALTTALALAACGGGNSNSGSGSATAASSGPSDTVSLKSINGVDALVDSKGNALYTSDQEKDGMVRCTGGCTSIWLPLTTSGQPTAASDVSGTVGALKRPDGTRQVTLDGRPLYRFAEDGGPGKATGNGVSDSFGGQTFTWHLESTGKSGDTSSGSTGSGGNSYGY
jgi:predicted lipoprotein with Yx(FWY)xxD motif